MWLACVAAAPSDSREPVTVLVFASDERLVPSTTALIGGLESSLAMLPMPVRMLSSFLDSTTIPTIDLTAARLSWYRERYSGTKVDVVVALGDPASEFVGKHGSAMWPGAAAVFVARRATAITVQSSLTPATGLDTHLDFAGTALAALRMVPETRSIVLLAGASASDSNFLKFAEASMAPLARHVTISTLSNLSFDDYKRRVADLPDDAIVMPVMLFADRDGRSFAPADAVQELAAASSRPFFSVFEAWIGNGVVGGNVIDYPSIGWAVGDAVGSIVSNPAAVAPVIPPPPPVWTFDARALARWQIARGSVPPQSRLLFEDPGPFTRYRTQILATAAVLLMQGGAIVALIVQRRRQRDAEAFNRAVMESLAAETAVLDRDGVVIATNDLWRRAQPAAGNFGLHCTVGQPYAGHDRTVSGQPEQRQLRAAVEAVLRGVRPEASIDYGWIDDAQTYRWSQVRIRRLARDAGGAFVAHVDLTTRRRAETELQRQLHEHAHLSTMATVGETAGALAHELNQPLAAMLSNAQALRHLLAGDRPDEVEIESIIQDIIDADKRAADVIARVRRLIRKDPFEMQPVDVNAVARDVVHIVTQTPLSAHVHVDERFATSGGVVSGDRVQLQQVLLNLLQNAVQAVGGHLPSGGRVMVATSAGASTVEVVVSDNGPGIPLQELHKVFDPFYTTRRDGLGLGLSISRTIVELHGGTLRATNGAGGGAVFTVTLPKAHSELAV